MPVSLIPVNKCDPYHYFKFHTKSVINFKLTTFLTDKPDIINQESSRYPDILWKRT